MNGKGITLVNSIDKDKLIKFLYGIDKDFVPSLSNRLSIPVYAEKLIENAKFIVAISDNTIIGLIAFYCNDDKKKKAHISIMGLSQHYRGLEIGSRLLLSATKNIRQEGFEKITLETWGPGSPLSFYQKHGFEITERIADSISDIVRVKMHMWLGSIDSGFKLNPTPLEYYNKISKNLGINFFVKRDDLFSLNGDGGKVRKLFYILKKAEKDGFDAFVTTGGNQSNLLRVSALNAAKFGWKILLVIHDTLPEKLEGNLKITNLINAELRFVKKSEIKEAMDQAMLDLKKQGYNPLYIWGGGHCVEGSFAFYEAVKELKNQLKNIKPDFLVVASGTGTTQAGLEVGIRHLFPDCKVLGVSVARNEKKGKASILESIKELNAFLDNPIEMPNDIFFDDHWVGEGHEAAYPELIETIYWAARMEGLLLDPTYTGKAFHGLKKYIENGIIPEGSNVVFWHSGGLLNLLASNEI